VTGAAWLLPALPFAAALAGFLLGRRTPRAVAPLAVGGTALATAVALPVALDAPRAAGRADEAVLATVSTGSLDIVIGTRVDGLSAVVAVMVCVVALLVQVYSIGYLQGDRRYSSYAAFVSLFTAAMLLVVVAADLIVLLVGWEVMGVCSYFLVGHHWELPEARSAAVKAFLVTRLGDVGFLFGIFTVGFAVGSFRVQDVLFPPQPIGSTTLTVATLLLLCGVVGKSAQFPLHTWLPDAMAGPTPISALIHAATMVAAGVYVVARLWPLFAAASTTLAVMAVIAAITMLGAALAALAQDDIKRVLAYSTVSQLAYMVGGLAVGGRDAAVFHLLTHAGFKALLFLAAGAVIHAVGSNLMSEMGGLRRALPVTFVTMTIGLAALVGLPPFSGFFSKEAVLAAAEESALHEGPLPAWSAGLVLVTGLLTVGVTAAYVTRMWLRTFFGELRAEAVQPHEVTGVMRWPLVVLAVPAALLGLAGLDAGWLPRWVTSADLASYSGPDAAQHALTPGVLTTVVSLGLAAAGVMGMYAAWRRDRGADPARVLGRARLPFERGFHVDDAYDAVFVRPTVRAARGVVGVDDHVVDAAVEGSGAGARLTGAVLRLSQNGNVQAYLTGLVAGVVLMVVSAAVLT